MQYYKAIILQFKKLMKKKRKKDAMYPLPSFSQGVITKRGVGKRCAKSFPGGTGGKDPACQFRRYKRCRLDPWIGKIPWRRARQPTPVVLPGESHGQRSLAGCRP